MTIFLKLFAIDDGDRSHGLPRFARYAAGMVHYLKLFTNNVRIKKS
jgi:hypothetical protein